MGQFRHQQQLQRQQQVKMKILIFFTLFLLGSAAEVKKRWYPWSTTDYPDYGYTTESPDMDDCEISRAAKTLQTLVKTEILLVKTIDSRNLTRILTDSLDTLSNSVI